MPSSAPSSGGLAHAAAGYSSSSFEPEIGAVWPYSAPPWLCVGSAIKDSFSPLLVSNASAEWTQSAPSCSSLNPTATDRPSPLSMSNAVTLWPYSAPCTTSLAPAVANCSSYLWGSYSPPFSSNYAPAATGDLYPFVMSNRGTVEPFSASPIESLAPASANHHHSSLLGSNVAPGSLHSAPSSTFYVSTAAGCSSTFTMSDATTFCSGSTPSSRSLTSAVTNRDCSLYGLNSNAVWPHSASSSSNLMSVAADRSSSQSMLCTGTMLPHTVPPINTLAPAVASYSSRVWVSNANSVWTHSASSGRSLSPTSACSSSAVMSDASAVGLSSAPNTSLPPVAAGISLSNQRTDISTRVAISDGVSLSGKQNCDDPTRVRVMPSSNVKLGHKHFKRLHDKKQFCPFCNKSAAKLPRHMETRHTDELEVEEVSKLPLKSSERKRLLEKLMRSGNYKHNVEVLRSNEGVIVPARRTGAEKPAESFVPCEYCLAFCLQRDLWKHIKACKHKPSDDDGLRRRHRSRDAMLLPSTDLASPGLKESVLARMNNGPEAILIRNDALLVTYGNNLYFQHGHAAHRHQYISQKLWQLARFMLVVRRLDNSIRSLADCINPSKFAVIIQAVKVVSGFDEQIHPYKIPSMTLKLGHSLHDCANIRIAEALQRGDVALQDTAANFVRLYQTQWAKQISSHALRTMTVRTMSQTQMLPLAEDPRNFSPF